MVGERAAGKAEHVWTRDADRVGGRFCVALGFATATEAPGAIAALGSAARQITALRAE